MSSSNVSQTTTATKSSQHGQFKSIPEAWEHYNAEHHPNTRHNGENNPYAKAPGDLHSFVPKDPSSGWTQQQKPWQLLHRDDEKMLWHCPETQTHHITRRAALTKQEQHQVHKSFPPAWAQQYEPLVNYVVPDPHDKYKRRNSLNYALVGEIPKEDSQATLRYYNWRFNAIVQPGDPDRLALNLRFVARDGRKLLWHDGEVYLVTHTGDVTTPFHSWA